MNVLSIITWKSLLFWLVSFSESWLPNWNFCLVYAAGLSEPLPRYYTVYSADPLEAILSTFWQYNFRDHNICSPFFLCIDLYKVNFSTANLLLNSYSKMCDTITMFNLIIANLDVKMRPRPAANPHQQEKKKRKYYIYDVSIRGKHNQKWC